MRLYWLHVLKLHVDPIVGSATALRIRLQLQEGPLGQNASRYLSL